MGWTVVTADAVISTVPCEVSLLVFRCNDNTGNLALYDGLDSGGRYVATFFADTVDSSKVVPFAPPLVMERGLFLDAIGDVDEALVIWNPLPTT